MKLLKEYEATEGQDGEKLLRLIFHILCHHLSGVSPRRLPSPFDYCKTFLAFPTEDFCHCSGSSVYHFQVPERDSSETSQHITASTRVCIDRCSSVRGNTREACARICLFDCKWGKKQKKQSETSCPYYTTRAEALLIS